MRNQTGGVEAAPLIFRQELCWAAPQRIECNQDGGLRLNRLPVATFGKAYNNNCYGVWRLNATRSVHKQQAASPLGWDPKREAENIGDGGSGGSKKTRSIITYQKQKN